MKLPVFRTAGGNRQNAGMPSCKKGNKAGSEALTTEVNKAEGGKTLRRR
jgi:hypothetical protein